MIKTCTFSGVFKVVNIRNSSIIANYLYMPDLWKTGSIVNVGYIPKKWTQTIRLRVYQRGLEGFSTLSSLLKIVSETTNKP